MIITIILFIAILMILVLSHEFGHFYAAKKSGMKVEEFGFGFPPKLFGIKKGETLYSFNLFPIGGFVKIYGEDSSAVPEDNGEAQNEHDVDRMFYKQPMLQRTAVIVSGVLVNFLLAYLLFSATHFFGIPTALSDEQEVPANITDVSVQIVGVLPNSPASEAGLQMGDKILALASNGQTIQIQKTIEAGDFIDEHKSNEIIFYIQRGKEELQFNVFARDSFPENEGPTGIALSRTGIAKSTLPTAFWEGAKTSVFITQATLVAFGGMLKSLVVSGNVPQDITGPVGIAFLTGTVRTLGSVYILQFIALISLSLGIINLMPFPALDGGRLLFLGIEKVKGSPVPKKVEGITHAVGFALLILLIIAVTIRDINRFF